MSLNTTFILGRGASPKAGAKQRLHNGWQRMKKLTEETQSALVHFERQQLDPLFDRALLWWGDRRPVQQQQVRAVPPSQTTDQFAMPGQSQPWRKAKLTAEDRTLNRGFYLCSGSLTLALVAKLLYPPLQVLSLPGLLYGAWHVYRKAYHLFVNERRLDVNIMLSIVTTAYIGGGYWVLGNLTNTSYFFSIKLLKVVKARWQEDLTQALMQHPRMVWTVVDGVEVQRPLAALQKGDVVLIHAGEVVPVDGVICGGSATLDEHMLTGEAHPVEKTAGDRVFTATLLLTGKVAVTVDEAGTETLVARIGQLLAQTVDFRSTRQLRTQQLTDQLVTPILGLGAVTWPFLGFSAAAGVVSNHPYTHLNIFGSLDLLNAFASAAEQGLLIKDGRTLELLQQVDTLVFDKTGTLTQEQPQVATIHCTAGVSEEQLLAYAAAAEQHQSHPIARAILSAAQQRGVAIAPVDEAIFKVGLGLAVRTNGNTILVGSGRFMALQSLTTPASFSQLQTQSQQDGHLLVWVARDGEIVGAIALQAALRPEASAVVTALRRLPKVQQVMILSGDHPVPTQQVAATIGADAWFAETLPTDKAALIARLQAEGRKVCFIGDGINDAVALKQAHVAVAMRGATLAAIDTAHVVLMDASLTQLPALFDLAHRFERRQRAIMVPVLGASALGLTGIYLWGWGLTAMSILGQISLIGGTSVVMQPHLFKAVGQ